MRQLKETTYVGQLKELASIYWEEAPADGHWDNLKDDFREVWAVLSDAQIFGVTALRKVADNNIVTLEALMLDVAAHIGYGHFDKLEYKTVAEVIAEGAGIELLDAENNKPWWADNDIHDHIINAGLKAMIADWCGFKPEMVNLLESSERDGFPTFVKFEVAGQGYYVDVETWEFGIDSSYYDRIFKCQCNYCK